MAATATGDGKGTRRPVMPLVAYAIVLALLVAAGLFLWSAKGAPGSGRASPAISTAAPTEPPRAAQGLTLPPRPAVAEATAPPRQEPAVLPPPPQSEAPAVPSPPSQSEANNDVAAGAAQKAAPPKTACTIDASAWPADKTDQAKAIQILLRDLGFYAGTTYGTVGPATREAIRKFQLASGEAETGEPSETVFALLRKKCASSP